MDLETGKNIINGVIPEEAAPQSISNKCIIFIPKDDGLEVSMSVISTDTFGF